MSNFYKRAIRHLSPGLFALFLVFNSVSLRAFEHDQPIIRILIAEANEIVVLGRELKGRVGEKTIARDAQKMTFKKYGNGFNINGKNTEAQQIVISSDTPIKFNNKTYTKKVLIKNNGTNVLLIQPLPLETYIAATVTGEVPSKWPREALEAQAIVSRTYAVNKMYKSLNQDFHLRDSVLDQVFNGFEKRSRSILLATNHTHGLIIVYDNQPIQAFFHSVCGDHTESSANVWGADLPYLRGSECGFCQEASKYRWETSISRTKLASALNLADLNISDIYPESKKESGRTDAIKIDSQSSSKIVSAKDIRAAGGYTEIPSTWITDMSVLGNFVKVKGRGFGHGVGMCQWGAYGMAKSGYSANEIIAKYFPGTEIRKMY